MKIKTMIALGGIIGTTAATTITLVALAKNTASKKSGTTISKFENLIDMMGVPVNYEESQYESRIAPFADLGSWHAFSLPSYESKSYLGGFTQPLIVLKNTPRSIAKSLDVLKINEYSLDKNGKPIIGSMQPRSLGKLPNDKIHLKQYPGGLWQEYEFGDFTLQLDLKFVQNKTSFVKYQIINNTKDNKAFQLIWNGEIFPGAKTDLGIKFVANGYHNDFFAGENKQYKVKYNKYGQALIKTKNFYNGAPDSSPLYLTYNNRYTEKENWRPKVYVAIGKDGHPPNTTNRWYAIGKKQVTEKGLLSKKIGEDWVSSIHFIYKGSDDKWKFDKRNAWNFNPKSPYGTFMLDKSSTTIPNKAENSLKITFDKPRYEKETNFLGHNDEWQWDMQFQKDVPMVIATQPNGYEASTKEPFIVSPKSKKSIFVGTTFTFTAQERFGFAYQSHGDNTADKVQGQLEVAGTALESNPKAQKLFDKSTKRWQTYLKNLLGNDLEKNQNFKYQKVAVKAMQTLVNNWRGNAGMLEHQGVTPSLSITWFNDFWSWDTWKQATAEVNFDPKLAIDNMKVMFDYQVTRDPKSKPLFNYSKIRQKNDVGMIPDLVSYRQGETNWRDTKPPLAAWGAYNVISTILNDLNSSTKDPHTNKTYKELAIDFGKYIYHRLIAYHLWWYSNRDGDHNGINEYGGTIFDGKSKWTNSSKESITTAAAWESGMDNAPRFDVYGSNRPSDKVEDFDDGLEYTIQRNNDGTVTGYVLQQESVDLNSYMYAEKNYIIKIGEILKKFGVRYEELQGSPKKQKKDKTYNYLVKPAIIDRLANLHSQKGLAKNILNDKNIQFGNSYLDDAKLFKKDMKYLKNYINTKMFDQKTGFFYDLKWKLSSDGQSRDISEDRVLSNRGAGPEGFIPLWAKVATKENAQSVKKFIMSIEGFNTYMPFPTVAYNNEKFEPDQYWRGPVWLDQAYFGVQGLNYNNFEKEASYMVDKLFHNAEGLLENKPIFENYNPLTGKGLNAKGFSWSSGMYLLMYKHYMKGDK